MALNYPPWFEKIQIYFSQMALNYPPWFEKIQIYFSQMAGFRYPPQTLFSNRKTKWRDVSGKI